MGSRRTTRSGGASSSATKASKKRKIQDSPEKGKQKHMVDSDSDNSTPSPPAQPKVNASANTSAINNFKGGPSSASTAPKPDQGAGKLPKRKPKPIIIDCNAKFAAKLIDDAKAKNIIVAGSVKTSSKGLQSMIQLDTLDDKSKFSDFLRSSNLQFHSFGEKEEKAQVFILKGCSGYTEREIEELFASNITAFTAKVKRISKEDSPYPVYRVLITGMIVSLVYLRHNFSSLGRIMVTWQAIRKDKNRATQCFRCQRFGHVSKECNHEFRCVKCAGNHPPGMCNRSSRDDGKVPLKCANCKGNHPANFTECESRKAYMKSLKKSPSAPKVAKPSDSTRVVHNKPHDETIISMPQIPQSSTWGAGPTSSTVNASGQDQPGSNERLIRLFTEKVAELQNTIKEMQSEINTLRSELAKTKLQQPKNTKPNGVSEIAGQSLSGKTFSPASEMSVT
jgi:hypothetical protein